MNQFKKDFDKTIDAIKNNKPTYFIDYKEGRKDVDYYFPKWVRHANATIDDVMQIVRETHFYPISNLNIREEKNLDEWFEENVTYREYFFGKIYQNVHETMYKIAEVDYTPIQEKAKENYFFGLEIKNELNESEVINA
jgi:hypothetical protein